MGNCFLDNLVLLNLANSMIGQDQGVDLDFGMRFYRQPVRKALKFPMRPVDSMQAFISSRIS